MTAPHPPSPEGETTESEGDEAYCVACNQSFSLDQMFCPTDGSKLIKLRSAPDQLLGRVFDQRYELRAVLGQGGMGTVYRAWQRSVDREVVVKVIHPKLASVRQIAKRFLREARLASRLNQQNIVSIYDFGQSDDGVLYMVMELLHGRPLAQDLLPRRPFPLRRITTIAAQICDALEAAHNHGIVHRDLKPHNIFLLDDPPGRDLIKILDFGLAKSLLHNPASLVTQTDALLGTPAYISPEQILGKAVDPRTDLYSLGCILYQLATGQLPFRGDNVNTVIGMHLRAAPPALPESLPPMLATLIARLMAKEPDARPATAALVHATVTSIASSEPSSMLELTQPSPMEFPRSNRLRLRRASAAMALAAATAIAFAFWSTRHAERGNAVTKATIAPIDAGAGSPRISGRVVVDASIALAPPSDASIHISPPPPPPMSPDPVRHSPSPSAKTVTRPRSHTGAAEGQADGPAARNPAHAAPGDGGLPNLDLIPTVRRSPL